MPEKPGLFSTAPIIRHSLATPITNILLNTELATDQLRQQTTNYPEHCLQRILLNAKYLQSALQLADAAVPAVFSPQTALEEVLALNEGAGVKKHLVSRVFLPRQVRLRGNKFSFQEAIVCLINNAFESYKPKQANKCVFLSALPGKQSIVVKVTDGGRGMGWFHQKLSTNQLYSTKLNHAGLGLYFVKNTVEQLFQGNFSLSSRPGRGTTVTLNFPWNNA